MTTLSLQDHLRVDIQSDVDPLLHSDGSEGANQLESVELDRYKCGGSPQLEERQREDLL